MEEKKVNEQEETKLQEASAATEEIKSDLESSKEATSIPEPLLTDQSSTDSTSTAVDAVATRKKNNKKILGIIIGIIGIVAVIAIVLVIALTPSKFDVVKKECAEIGKATVTTDKGYFTVVVLTDINSSAAEKYPGLKSMVLSMYQKQALETIQYANKELGFSDDVYSQMLHTNARMGRQSEENSKYKVTWTYHPDDGLIVTYSKK